MRQDRYARGRHRRLPFAPSVDADQAIFEGLRVVVDPGHGGDDPGFVGPGGAREDDVCFAIAIALEAALTASGTQVFLTRRAGDGPADAERATLANTLEADLFLALHAGGAEPSARGAAAFYFGHERFHSETGLRVAEMLLEHVCTLGFIDGRAHAKTFPVLRETRMPAVMLEAGYITNPDEEQLLVERAASKSEQFLAWRFPVCQLL